MMTKPDMPVKMAPGVPMPAYAHADDAAFNLKLVLDAPITLQQGEMSPLMGTGFSCAFPAGYFGMLVPRSSMAKRGMMLVNTIGIIDNGYRGEIKARLYNFSGEPQVLNPGDELLQMVLLPYMQANLMQVETLPDTTRGDGGFGSTNK